MSETPPPPPSGSGSGSGSGWPGSGGSPPPSGGALPPSGGTPPSPPPAQPQQPRPQPQQTGGGREKWWSTGRVIGAIVIVLVLMGGSATAGFFAGAAWSGMESIGQGIADDFNEGFQDGFDEDLGGGFDDGVDGPTVEGQALQVGDTITGTLDEDGEAEHELTVDAQRRVTVELRSDDFDTTVTVLDQSGNELAYNDDIEFGEDRDSRVEVDLDPGTYTILVDAFGFGEGDYELSVR